MIFLHQKSSKDQVDSVDYPLGYLEPVLQMPQAFAFDFMTNSQVGQRAVGWWHAKPGVFGGEGATEYHTVDTPENRSRHLRPNVKYQAMGETLDPPVANGHTEQALWVGLGML